MNSEPNWNKQWDPKSKQWVERVKHVQPPKYMRDYEPQPLTTPQLIKWTAATIMGAVVVLTVIFICGLAVLS